jgi:hypothetical protein
MSKGRRSMFLCYTPSIFIRNHHKQDAALQDLQSCYWNMTESVSKVIFSDETSCNLVKFDRHFGGCHCPYWLSASC